ncbi:hypothetical protein ES703_118361 [subsurface metagenome]
MIFYKMISSAPMVGIMWSKSFGNLVKAILVADLSTYISATVALMDQLLIMS